MDRRVIYFLVLLAGAAWAWWDALVVMGNRWARDPEYSHGYLMPVFACALLWMRRKRLVWRADPGSWWGVGLLVIALALRLAGARFYMEWLDAISLLPALAGICLVAFGWRVFRWALPMVAFLVFMIPLPFRIEQHIQHPLRRLGTVGGVYAMQTVGLPAVSRGNVIMVGDVQLGVAEACSGLSMLMVFMALTSAAAMLSSRPAWERTVIVLSGLLIAIAANVARIAVTGVLFALNKSELANRVFHDFAGWLMMPFAFALLFCELWLLSKLFVQEEQTPVKIGLK
ncbi:MAG: exosortase [Planctomycetaceae bacterium]